MAKKYKYSCRKCPIRNRCIEESNNPVHIKEMARHAFKMRTDTLSTWGLLQPNCLLIKAEEEQVEKAQRDSLLTQRLRKARQAKKKESPPQIRPLPKRPPKAKRDTTPPSPLPTYLQPVSQTDPALEKWTKPITGKPNSELEATLQNRRPVLRRLTPYRLTISGTGRHITLPVEGSLTLGRFDATFGVPPDIDLAYEDGDNHRVSRRHAKINRRGEFHTIEDTGSQYGVFVNGHRVSPTETQPLRPGDKIKIGSVRLLYEEIPTYLKDVYKAEFIRHLITVTPTGRRMFIAPANPIIIGRSDRFVEFAPDIDLSQDGDVASRVSRRHAAIHWRGDRPYVEDLGSGFGTRINGEEILIGEINPLRPGDHIWLGGCVLAYDVQI